MSDDRSAGRRRGATFALALAAHFLCPAWGPAQEPFRYRFRDVAEEVGLLPAVADMHAHAAAWGDVDGDGWPDLYVGTFHKGDSKTNRFFRNRDGKFRLDERPELRVSARSSGAVFADLSGDGRHDFYLSNLGGGADGPDATGNKLFRNDGGRLVDVTKGSGAAPPGFRGRSVAVLDFDGDGKLDLLLGESTFYGSPMRSRLLRNLGDMRFEDVTEKAGLPAAPALGVAVADVNLDGRPDIFLASNQGGNRLLLNNGDGTFREAPGSPAVFAWSDAKGEDTPCGVAFGDVTGDGRPDLVIGHHYKSPWVEPVPIRLYLNRPGDDGEPRFEDVTDRVGLPPLPMKAPHVEVRDFDNDGRPDIYTSIVKFADGKPYPVIFRNLGVKDGLPRFEDTTAGLIEFPTDEERAIRRAGDLFDRLLRDGKITYTAAAPSCDFDRDGRLDIFVSSWWREQPALLLKNETPSGHWLRVKAPVGSRVTAYHGGERVSSDEVSAGYGYSSGQLPVAHLGLGELAEVDLVIELPHGRGRIERRAPADREIDLTKEDLP